MSESLEKSLCAEKAKNWMLWSLILGQHFIKNKYIFFVEICAQ